MNAGRELDAEIAEEVMGWTPRGAHPIHGCPMFATGSNDTFAPYFSTDIAAAWQVVQKMGESCDQATIEVCGGEWMCEFDGVGDQAHTAPLAICLAALKAVGDA